MSEHKTPMDCYDFCEIYLDLDRPETRGAALCDEALAHAESCSACATRLMESESLGFSLRKVAEAAERMEAPARVEAALMAEFRRARVTAGSSAYAGTGAAAGKFKWETVWFAVAAMVLLALGLTIYKRQALSSSGTQAPSAAANTIAAPATSSASSESAANAQVAATSVAATSTAASSASVKSATGATGTDADNAEYASEFVALPYADGLTDSDSGTVVRVDLPRSSLASMGIPVSGLAAGDRVVADLVVSDDGTPQAIRLVSQAN